MIRLAGYPHLCRLCTASAFRLVNLLHRSHNAPVIYPTPHHFVIEICTRAHFCYKVVHYEIFVWCIVGFVRWVFFLCIIPPPPPIVALTKCGTPGPWFNKYMLSYQHRKSHGGDKTVVTSFYLHNRNSFDDICGLQNVKSRTFHVNRLLNIRLQWTLILNSLLILIFFGEIGHCSFRCGALSHRYAYWHIIVDIWIQLERA